MTNEEATHIRLRSQLLVGSTVVSPRQVVAHLGSMQSQDYRMFAWAIGMRMRNPAFAEVAKALEKGEIVRSHLLRCTVQTVAVDDYWMMVELCREQNQRSMRSWQSYVAADIDERLFDEVNAALPEQMGDGASLTKRQIAEKLREVGFPADRIHVHLFIMQAEVAGIIASGRMEGRFQTWALTEGRIAKPNKPLQESEAMAQLARLYFQSHSPATVDDFCWWTGLAKSKCKKGIEAISSELQEVEVDGVPMLVHISCLKEDSTNGASLLFLPPYDEYLIGYKSRHLAVESRHEHKAYNRFGIFQPVILLDGRVCGNWRIKALRQVETELFRYKRRISNRRMSLEAERVAKFYAQKV